jgi:hypothetical protein
MWRYLTCARHEHNGRTYPCRCVNSQQTLRLIKGEEACFANFVLMEEFGVSPGPYGAIDAIEVIKENQEVSLRIDEA